MGENDFIYSKTTRPVVLSRRDEFAKAIAPAVIGGTMLRELKLMTSEGEDFVICNNARLIVKFADAMIAELDKGQPNG